ncbi:MAG: hypothetical protein ACXVWU_00090 [Nocardioides sp.]
MSPRQRLIVRSWPWLLALAVLAPTLRRGYLLSYDMVFVPALDLRSDFLGLGSGLPRAVPSDALVALVDNVVPGAVLERVVLVAALVLAGTGACRLVSRRSPAAQLAASALYVWNPFVAERLVIGHWPVLLAYGTLPWVADTANGLRRGERRFPALLLWLALAATSASGGVTAGVVALAFGLPGVTSRAGRRRAAALVSAVLATNAAWLSAGILHAGVAATAPAGATAFAARGEGHLPAPLALLGLGGVWNSEVVPSSRSSLLPWVSLGVVVAVCALGARSWWRQTDRRQVAAYLACAAVAMAVALLGVVTPAAARVLVHDVPGAGLFRDGARYLGLLALGEASLFGAGAQAVAGSSGDWFTRRTLTAGVVLAPLALLPDLAWGVMGRLQPVEYPPAYAVVRSALNAAHREQPGDLLVLPFTSYRRPAWNDGHKVLDPLGRYMSLDYVASDQLSVSGHLLPGEDPRASAVLRILARRTAPERVAGLRSLGIRYVVVDRSAPGAGDPRFDPPVPGVPVVSAGDLRLVALPGTVRDEGVSSALRIGAGIGFGALTASVLVAVGMLLSRRVARATRRS